MTVCAFLPLLVIQSFTSLKHSKINEAVTSAGAAWLPCALRPVSRRQQVLLPALLGWLAFALTGYQAEPSDAAALTFCLARL